MKHISLQRGRAEFKLIQKQVRSEDENRYPDDFSYLVGHLNIEKQASKA